MGRCHRFQLTALAVFAVLIHNAAAWNAANNCTDEVVGYSPWFGVQGDSKPQRIQNHTAEWEAYGPITKLNLYYSWNFGCLQGIKPTYGYKSGHARIIGHEKRLYTTHMKLAGWENINRVDVRQEPNKCINYIKFYTTKGRAMGFGNSASTSPLLTAKPPMQGGFLAHLKGWEDLVEEKNTTGGENLVAGGLKSLQFVWAAEFCPNINNSTTTTTIATRKTILMPALDPIPTAPTPIPTQPLPPLDDDVQEEVTVEEEEPAPQPVPPTDNPMPVVVFPIEGPAEPQPQPPPPTPPPQQQAPPPEPEQPPPSPPPPTPPPVKFQFPREIPDMIEQQPMVMPSQPEQPLQQSPAVYDMPPQDTTAAAQTPTEDYYPEGQAVCPGMPSMCSEAAAQGEANFCPAKGPFTYPGCEGGCCVTSGKCSKPLCRLNGLGEDVAALDFICYGANKGPFEQLNKCRGLRCKLTVPGCRTGSFGGNCVGYLVVDPELQQPASVLDPHAVRYLGHPCIEVASLPHGPNMPKLSININFRKSATVSLEPVGEEDGRDGTWQEGEFHSQTGGPDGGMYATGLWTVCDCKATQKHPVLPAIPLFGLKKGLLGKTHPLFAGMLAGAADAVAKGAAAGGQCQGPVCALLPMLAKMNLTLADVQVPMTLLANLTALLHPHPLALPPVEGLIPQIQLPEVNVTIDTTITRPELPTFADCAKYLIEFAKALKPVVTDIAPHLQTQPAQAQLGALAKIASNVLAALRAQGAPQQADPSQPLPRFNVKEVVDLISKLVPSALRGGVSGKDHKQQQQQPTQQQQQQEVQVNADNNKDIPTVWLAPSTNGMMDLQQPPMEDANSSGGGSSDGSGSALAGSAQQPVTYAGAGAGAGAGGAGAGGSISSNTIVGNVGTLYNPDGSSMSGGNGMSSGTNAGLNQEQGSFGPVGLGGAGDAVAAPAPPPAQPRKKGAAKKAGWIPGSIVDALTGRHTGSSSSSSSNKKQVRKASSSSSNAAVGGSSSSAMRSPTTLQQVQYAPGPTPNYKNYYSNNAGSSSAAKGLQSSAVPLGPAPTPMAMPTSSSSSSSSMSPDGSSTGASTGMNSGLTVVDGYDYNPVAESDEDGGAQGYDGSISSNLPVQARIAGGTGFVGSRTSSSSSNSGVKKQQGGVVSRQQPTYAARTQRLQPTAQVTTPPSNSQLEFEAEGEEAMAVDAAAAAAEEGQVEQELGSEAADAVDVDSADTDAAEAADTDGEEQVDGYAAAATDSDIEDEQPEAGATDTDAADAAFADAAEFAQDDSSQQDTFFETAAEDSADADAELAPQQQPAAAAVANKLKAAVQEMDDEPYVEDEAGDDAATSGVTASLMSSVMSSPDSDSLSAGDAEQEGNVNVDGGGDALEAPRPTSRSSSNGSGSSSGVTASLTSYLATEAGEDAETDASDADYEGEEETPAASQTAAAQQQQQQQQQGSNASGKQPAFVAKALSQPTAAAAAPKPQQPLPKTPAAAPLSSSVSRSAVLPSVDGSSDVLSEAEDFVGGLFGAGAGAAAAANKQRSSSAAKPGSSSSSKDGGAPAAKAAAVKPTAAVKSSVAAQPVSNTVVAPVKPHTAPGSRAAGWAPTGAAAAVMQQQQLHAMQLRAGSTLGQALSRQSMLASSQGSVGVLPQQQQQQQQQGVAPGGPLLGVPVPPASSSLPVAAGAAAGFGGTSPQDRQPEAQQHVHLTAAGIPSRRRRPAA